MLLVGPWQLRRRLACLRRVGRAAGVPRAELDALALLAARGFRTALAAAHLEDLRGLLATWRFLHRWVALLMVLLLAVHVFSALRYGAVWPGGAG